MASKVLYPNPAAAAGMNDAKNKSHVAAICITPDVREARARFFMTRLARSECTACSEGNETFTFAKAFVPPTAVLMFKTTHCAIAPMVVPTASAISGRSELPPPVTATIDNNTHILPIPGDKTGMVILPATVDLAIAIPFTAASKMHGDMIRSCSATVTYSVFCKPGEVRRTTKSENTNVNTLSAAVTAQTTVTTHEAACAIDIESSEVCDESLPDE
jgi:hypothetical protein